VPLRFLFRESEYSVQRTFTVIYFLLIYRIRIRLRNNKRRRILC
jgi:hypothetical protein